MSRKRPAQAAPVAQRDLMVLAADKNAEQLLQGLLGRHEALRIRPLTFDLRVHPERDPGCLSRAFPLLNLYATTHRHALVLFDREGSGQDEDSRLDLEAQVLAASLGTPWKGRAAVVVVDPEIDTWVWSTSPHVPAALGWVNQTTTLPEWLAEQGYLTASAEIKPARPKEAMEAVLREVKKPRSSAIYKSLAEKVSFQKCADAAFLRLMEVLRGWFPSGA